MTSCFIYPTTYLRWCEKHCFSHDALHFTRHIAFHTTHSISHDALHFTRRIEFHTTHCIYTTFQRSSAAGASWGNATWCNLTWLHSLRVARRRGAPSQRTPGTWLISMSQDSLQPMHVCRYFWTWRPRRTIRIAPWRKSRRTSNGGILFL